MALSNALEIVQEPVEMTKAELAQAKADNMEIPKQAVTFMNTAISGQTAYAMALFVMFDANPVLEWIGNGSASGIAKHRTMCKPYRDRIMSEFGISNSTVSESWQAGINNQMLIDIGAVVDNGENLEIDLAKIKACYKDRATNGFEIRIHRPETKKGPTYSGSKDSAKADTANKAVDALNAVGTMLGQSEGDKLKVIWKEPDATGTSSAKVALTDGQKEKIIAGAVGILRKYAGHLLVENA